ncbi:MAG: TetR/AcrR family transcriptional regulator [Actinomycetota bacterium]|nr:TetR/AcrR family transcriptional regulator [Actinomycetota bacterium]
MSNDAVSADEIAESDSTRERLIEVTIQLLDQRGNHALRLADVAREAGVAVSTIYAHFRDRTDLVAAARLVQFKAHADVALEMVETALVSINTSDDLAAAAFWPSLRSPDDEQSRSRRWDRIEAIADARHIPELSAQLEEMQTTLTARATELARRGQELGMVDPEVDPAALALLTQVLRLGLALWDLSGDARPSLEAWTDLLDRIGHIVLVDPADAAAQPRS